MNRKRVLVVYIITKLELGGAQKVCLSLFEGVAQSGCVTTLISGAQGPLVRYVATSQNVYLLEHMTNTFSLRGMWNELRVFFRLVNVLCKLKKNNDAIIVHTHSTKAGILGRWAAFFARIPLRVHTVHGYAFHAHQSRIIWWLIYCGELVTSFMTTHFVCVSAHDVKTGSALFPRFARKHSIIRAAVDQTQFYQPAKIAFPIPGEKEPFIFGSISCFKPQKNLFDLLRAFQLVQQAEPRARLEIIGDGRLRPDIEQWIREHTLERAIVLHGWKSAVAPLMRLWHVFVLSSLWEGLPCALVEARLLGLPIVSYDTGGIREVVMNQENGLLYQPGDWQGLAAGMRRMMIDGALYRACRHYQDALGDFALPHMVQEHVTLYEQLLNRSGQNHKIMSP